MKRHEFWHSERGFTLLEVLVTIMIMGILFAIAASTWIGVVESRRVDSAANQMVSDLRLAHTTATNRLQNWRVEMDADTGNYRMGPDGGTLSSYSLPEGTEYPPGMGVSAIVFKSSGDAQVTGAGNITVAADDGAPTHAIEVNTLTSRIEVVG